jgi:SM-20-related protein
LPRRPSVRRRWVCERRTPKRDADAAYQVDALGFPAISERIAARHARIARDLAGAGFSIQPGFVPRGECARLARRGRTLWQRGALREAATGRGVEQQRQPGIRGDRIRWIDPSIATRGETALLARIERLRIALNQSLQLGAFDLEMQWALYPRGAHYARHLDVFRGTRARVVSLVLYLNETWQPGDGGALRLHLDAATQRDVTPLAGTLVAFLSDRFEHEVLPARRERLSIAGWLRQRC